MRLDYMLGVALVAICQATYGLGASTGPLMHTNIALVGADPSNTRAVEHNLENVLIDPVTLIDQASAMQRPTAAELGDIEEDEHDRFITTSKGKTRPELQTDDTDDWANDDFIAPATSKPLSRVKRCGGGGGGGDDDDADRSRRSRRARRARKVKKTKKKKNGTKTTVVSRKVIQGNQVVSHTIETQQQTVVQQPVVQTTTSVQQVPVVHQTVQTVEHQAPVVQHVVQPGVQQVIQPGVQQVIQPGIQQVVQPAVQTVAPTVQAASAAVAPAVAG